MAWQKAGLPYVRIAVNLSIIQFQSPDIVEQIKEILRKTGLEPQYLELEITESIAMRDTEYIINVLNEFRALGIYISIDDFGTEFSSLNYLKLLPINRIKIPMPFIKGIALNERDEAITKTIIVLAKNMGLDVIAEGVETKEQEAFLTRRMCNEMQGFYYYRPMRAADIENIMLKG
jgi:EAL domain-containing protein (putative c-di-GMP-specific phosphodiesterase class I)